jgi:hypothetical protein
MPDPEPTPEPTPPPADPNALAVNFTPVILEGVPEIPAREAVIPNTPKIMRIDISVVEAPLKYNANIHLEWGHTRPDGTYRHLPMVYRDIRVENIFSVPTQTVHPELKNMSEVLYGGSLAICSRITDSDGLPCIMPPANAAAMMAAAGV